MVRDLRTFTPKKAAEEIGCSGDTIRRYCRLYRRHLSEGATPTPGRPRLLTAVDVFLLKVAKAQAEAGLTIEETDDLLATVAIPEDVIDASPLGAEVGEVARLPAPVGEALEGFALLRQMAMTLEKLEAKEARLAKVEADIEEKSVLLARLQDDIADLRVKVETQSPAGGLTPSQASAPRPSLWAAYGPYIVGVGVVVGIIVAVALVVALFS